ncbi:MAG TPA: hypothetical protein VGN93_31185 [Shinella sp.]|jgi:hypothetical protein|uniref:hypothetical protein n=1 Tax=Shinella sp. TaxID=1870904 RepID=UPI002E14DC19|nr:hypothetical protein [Shinella sp.]
MISLSISPTAVVAAFRDVDVALPLRLSDSDIGVILDDEGVDVITIDVNGDRSDDQVTAIAAMIISAVNNIAGMEAAIAAAEARQ